jgi:archaellum biogenesis ATPase FlaH
MRKTTIITGGQGTGKSMLARKILKGEQKPFVEVVCLDTFKSNIRDFGSRVNYLVDGVCGEAELIRVLVAAKKISSSAPIDFNAVVCIQELSDKFISDNLEQLRAITIIRTIKY